MNSSNLVLHCGAQKAERSQVAESLTPAGTDTWRPVPHIELVNQVERALASHNMRIVTEAHGLSTSGERYFGLFQVANCLETVDYGYVVGLRNSHDKAFRASLAVGSSVFVCDNLSFSGEITIARKHTSRILEDFPALTGKAVGMLAERWSAQAERIGAYKQTELSNMEAHDLVIRAHQLGALPASRVIDVANEWETPRHPEFAESRNVWRLFNAFTENLKGSLWALPNRTTALHGLLDGRCGLLAQN